MTMTNTAHTPAPWLAHLSQDHAAIIEMSDGHQFYIGGENQDIDCIDANARLIAAAPDMLEALMFILSDAALSVKDAREVARSAIAKARG